MELYVKIAVVLFLVAMLGSYFWVNSVATEASEEETYGDADDLGANDPPLAVPAEETAAKKRIKMSTGDIIGTVIGSLAGLVMIVYGRRRWKAGAPERATKREAKKAEKLAELEKSLTATEFAELKKISTEKSAYSKEFKNQSAAIRTEMGRLGVSETEVNELLSVDVSEDIEKYEELRSEMIRNANETVYNDPGKTTQEFRDILKDFVAKRNDSAAKSLLEFIEGDRSVITSKEVFDSFHESVRSANRSGLIENVRKKTVEKVGAAVQKIEAVGGGQGTQNSIPVEKRAGLKERMEKLRETARTSENVDLELRNQERAAREIARPKGRL